MCTPFIRPSYGYAAGPFTRIDFVICPPQRDYQIQVHRTRPVNDAGSLLDVIPSWSDRPGMSLCP